MSSAAAVGLAAVAGAERAQAQAPFVPPLPRLRGEPFADGTFFDDGFGWVP